MGNENSMRRPQILKRPKKKNMNNAGTKYCSVEPIVLNDSPHLNSLVSSPPPLGSRYVTTSQG